MPRKVIVYSPSKCNRLVAQSPGIMFSSVRIWQECNMNGVWEDVGGVDVPLADVAQFANGLLRLAREIAARQEKRKARKAKQ